MNDFNAQNQNQNQNQNTNPQGPSVNASDNRAAQENVYTVGANYGQRSAPRTNNDPAQGNPNQPPRNDAPAQGYTAPSGNSYTYSTYTPPYGQPNGQQNGYSYTGTPQQPPKKKRARGGIIALAVAGCLLLSLMMGVGGAALAVAYMSQDEAQAAEDQVQDMQDTQQGTQQGALNPPAANAGGSHSPALPQNVTIKKNTGSSVTQVSGEIGDEDLSYADVVALVEDSVVEITTNYVVSGSMFSQYVSSGAGSGVIISHNDGIACIVTNNHVIDGATSIIVRLKDGTELDATLVGSDSMTDIALLTVTTDLPLTTAALGDSESLVVGQEVIAIGNPLGQLGGTVTNGIISALEREVTIGGDTMTLLQTNAAVNPGNSGGGLFNMRGELIGVVNAKSSGDDVEGLGFAIPVNTVYDISTELIEHGYVRGRPALGITVSKATQQYFMQVYSYIVVTDPGQTALQKNDILYTIDGEQIGSTDDISAAISGKSVGDKVEIVVSRNGKEVSVEVELIEFVPDSITQ